MDTFLHDLIDNQGIKLHTVQCGSGLPVIFCHGMPGLWYSWRHQLPVVAEAGFRAIAFDQRGYGRSDRPGQPEHYTSHHTVSDALAILDHLGEEKAVFVGTDFGAAQAYNIAVRHPERVAGVIGMSCPYDFDFAGRGGAGSHPPADTVYQRYYALPHKKPSECFAEIAAHQFYYAHYYQTPEAPEREFTGRIRELLTRLMWALSARGNLLDQSHWPENPQGYLEVLAEPESPLPWPWLSEEDMDYYVQEYERGGPLKEFIGGINAYRVADANWEINAAYADALIEPPSAFIAGEKDPVLTMGDPEALKILKHKSRDLRGIHLIPDAGHFVQQEQPEETNRVIVEFLESLKSGR